jgi:hypothetical protein
MDSQVDFKRMVLGLPHSAKDYASVAFTAELADLLGLDLVAIFAEDERLIDLALLPCVREFRLAGDGWHRLDVKQLEQSSTQAAADARRLFADASKALRGVARLDFIKGQVDEVIGVQAMPDDIIVVIEPKDPAERVTYQFRQFVKMALGAPTAALLVPSRISRRKGPVVAIAANERDASIQVGLRVAEAAGERLLVLTQDIVDETVAARRSPTGAVHIDQRSLPTGEIGLPELASALAIAGERLLVMSRGSNNLFPSQLASELGVPVLVTARHEPSSRPVD